MLNSAYFPRQKHTLSDAFANGSARDAQECQTFCVRVSLCVQYVLSLSQFATDPRSPFRCFKEIVAQGGAHQTSEIPRVIISFQVFKGVRFIPTKTGCIGLQEFTMPYPSRSGQDWLPACRKYSRLNRAHLLDYQGTFVIL